MKSIFIIGIFIFIWATCATYGIIGFCLGWIPAVLIASVVEDTIRG